MQHYTATISNQETMGFDNLNYFLALFHKLLHYFWAKLVISFALLPALLFDPEHTEGLAALSILIFMDFVSGVYTAKKTGEQIKSAKWFRTALKFAVYFTLVSAGHLVNVAGLNFVHVDAIILAFLATTELISIIENAGRCGYAVPQRLLNQLRKFRDNK